MDEGKHGFAGQKSAHPASNPLTISHAEQNGVTEQLKAENQMEWVRQMNACKAQAEEIVKAELIYDWARKSGQKTVRTFLI